MRLQISQAYWRGKSRNLQDAADGKGTAKRAAVLRGISLTLPGADTRGRRPAPPLRADAL